MSENLHQLSSMTTSKTVDWEVAQISSRTQKMSTENVYRQIVVSLTDQYMAIKEHYNLNEDATVDKIIEIAQKLCSRI